MKIREIITELKFKRSSIADIAKVEPRDTKEYDRYMSLFPRGKDPLVGPHEGKILELMLAGMKPAALINRSELGKFKPYIDAGKLKLVGYYDKEPIITLPGEEWRGKKLVQLWPTLGPAVRSGNEDLEAKIHAQIGTLLGYPKEAIRHFLGKKKA